MDYETYRPEKCPICGSNKIQPRYAASGNWKHFECLKCGALSVAFNCQKRFALAIHKPWKVEKEGAKKC